MGVRVYQCEFIYVCGRLDKDFVTAFLNEFDAEVKNMCLGAPRRKELSNLLSSMYKKKILDRYSYGVPHRSKEGYPKWVYSCILPTKKIDDFYLFLC